MNTQKIQTLDSGLINASKKIKVLSTLAWPLGVEEKFLEGWQKGNPKLPEIKIQPPDLKDSVTALEAIAQKCEQDDPVEKFLAVTALSYANAGRMLMNVGTTEFTKYSTKIYSRPDVIYKKQGISGVDGANFF